MTTQMLTDSFATKHFPQRIGRILWCVLGGLCAVSTMAQTEDVLAKLKANGKLMCQPAEPNFCLNVHVSCAGKTNYEAFKFALVGNAKHTRLTAADGFEHFNEFYAASQTEWSDDGEYALIRPGNGKGYVKLFKEGKYVFRYYPPNQEGLMSLGMCE